jgi:hypothetical protein
LGSVLICHGARIVLNPQRLDWSKMLRVETTRAPHFQLKIQIKTLPKLDGGFLFLEVDPTLG